MRAPRPAIGLDGVELPRAWLVGEFEIEVEELKAGRWDAEAGLLRGAAGRAWLRIPCALPPVHTPIHLPVDIHGVDLARLTQRVEVVDVVRSSQTEIALTDARRLQPEAAIGQSISLDLTIGRDDLQRIIEHGRGVHDWLDTDPAATAFLVEFTELTVAVHAVPHPVARVIDGVVTYPAAGLFHRPAEIVIDGFVLVLSSIELTPLRAHAAVTVRIPGGLADAVSCQPATIDLGVIALSPTCNYYVDAPDKAYGPWLLGDTGLVIEGTGFVLDLSTATSPPPWPPSWRGLALGPGTASGKDHIPEPCNTGYLRGTFTFTGSVVLSVGFFGTMYLAAPVSFEAINPIGQRFEFREGGFDVWYTKIVRGELKNGWTLLPVDAVCDGTPGSSVLTTIDVVSIQPDLDLAGVIDHGNREIAWGELTRDGEELVTWAGLFGPGYLYMPAGPAASFSPVATGSFGGPAIDSIPDASLATLEALQVSGVSFPALTTVRVFSPDRPGGRSRPFEFQRLRGWIRVGVNGVDGEVSTYYEADHEPLGEPAGSGYVGKVPFDANLFANDRRNLLAQFVTSAASDSNFAGTLAIPAPCGIPKLSVAHMNLTSTANLVGGDVALPAGGVPLAYWGLQLVPTGPPDHAGVVSVRTGRVLLTAAGISEDVHFAKPFGLTWGEMLADGNLGQLFLDFNNWGQRFDGLNFDPHQIALSKYDTADKHPYLGVWGNVGFPFFGLHPVNVSDAIGDATMPAPANRLVTVPKTPITPDPGVTALALSGTWHDSNSEALSTFTCLEADVDYNIAGQDGFIGTGTSNVSFLDSGPLAIQVEIHSDATDIHLHSDATHDIDLSLVARLGGLARIDGCARIEGPTLTRMSLYGSLERSVAVGSIFGPKAGYEAEINISVTPTTFDFYLSGDLLVSVALVDLEAAATVHLRHDFAAGSAEGELFGQINADAVVAGLSGEGQLTWFLGSSMQYLQGRLKVGVISLIVSGGLEGGFFIGNNVPKTLAWVLDPTDTRFGMSRSILPATLTGVYGYGQASFGVNYYVFGGGVDLFVGAGAFSAPIAAGGPLAPFAGNPLLPYVVGSCGVSVHGEILGGLVSASAWANLSLRGPVPTHFEGTFGLKGCVAWVLCASTDITAGVDDSGFYVS
jgi:hypothetical protein